jgi:hypothetical protein
MGIDLLISFLYHSTWLLLGCILRGMSVFKFMLGKLM